MKVKLTEQQFRRVILKESKGTEKCKAEWETAKKPAVEFWELWLADPLTRQKFKKNWGIKFLDKQVDKIFDDYREVVKNIIIKPSNDGSMSDAYAWVRPSESLKQVWVNCDVESSPSKKIDTLVHEIQHLLGEIKPLNPHRKIHRLFGDFQEMQRIVQAMLVRKKEKREDKNKSRYDKGKREKKLEDKLYGSLDDGTDEYYKDFPGGKNAFTKAVARLRQILQQPKDYINALLITWYNEARDIIQWDDALYTCDEDENMSRIFGIRHQFKISPNQQLSLSHLKPYILKEKPARGTNLQYLIHCWALNGFPDIKNWISKLNKLADIQQEKDSKSV